MSTDHPAEQRRSNMIVRKIAVLIPEDFEDLTPTEDNAGMKEDADSPDGPETVIASEPKHLVGTKSLRIHTSQDLNETSMPKEIKQLLYTLPFFSTQLDDTSAFIDEICKFLRVRQCKKGDVVIRQGEVAKAMFFIIKGVLQVISEDGEIAFAELSSGSYFGEIAILSDITRIATVICKTNCTLLTLTAENVQKQLTAFPSIKKNVKELAYKRLFSLRKEYERLGKKMDSKIEMQIDLLESSYNSINNLSNLPAESSTHVGPDELLDEASIIVEDDPIADSPMSPTSANTNPFTFPISSAKMLGQKLREARRASVAVWADDKLTKFAQNAVSQAAAKESRFAQYSSKTSIGSETESLIDPEKTNGFFPLTKPILGRILQLVDFKSLFRFRSASKYCQALIADKELRALERVNLSIYSKTLNDTKLDLVSSVIGSLCSELTLKNCWPITNDGLSRLAKSCPKLTVLDLSSVWDMTDVGLIQIGASCPLLTSIDCSNCRKITDIGVLSLIENVTCLKSVNFAYCKNLTGRMMNHLSWSKMKSINLQRCTGIRDDGFMHWKAGPLDTLSLASVPFALQDLNLSDCSFLTDQSVEVIAHKCPQLKRLCLSFCCSLTEAFSTHLGDGCPLLEVLDVSYCGGAVTDDALLEIAGGLPKLTLLSLRGCVQVTDLGISYLAEGSHYLRFINFTQCKAISKEVHSKLNLRFKCIETRSYSFSCSLSTPTRGPHQPLLPMEYAISRLTTDVSRTLKPTHVQTLIQATYSRQVTMSDLIKHIAHRLRDDRWIVVFKTLSVLHLLLREGNSDRILGFLCGNMEVLQQAFYKPHGNQVLKYIKTYCGYLEAKAVSFKALKFDWVRSQDEAVAKFRTIEDVTDLLHQTEALQKQIDAAIACNWEIDQMSDIVIQQGYRFMLAEQFTLFLLGNEAIVRVLSLYFEMKWEDAKKALGLYQHFSNQAKKMQDIFQTAKKNVRSIDVPKFKTPPLSLATKLEEYLNAPDFEEQRRANRAKRGTKEPRFSESGGNILPSPSKQPEFKQTSTAKQSEKEKPLIDFFNTIEEEMTGYNRAQSPEIPQFNTMWNDQVNDIQQQIQETNNILNSSNNAGFGQQNQFNNNGFSQNPFGTQNQFETSVSNNGGFNPFQFNQTFSGGMDRADPFASKPTFSSHPMQQMNSPQIQQMNPGQMNSPQIQQMNPGQMNSPQIQQMNPGQFHPDSSQQGMQASPFNPFAQGSGMGLAGNNTSAAFNSISKSPFQHQNSPYVASGNPNSFQQSGGFQDDPFASLMTAHIPTKSAFQPVANQMTGSSAISGFQPVANQMTGSSAISGFQNTSTSKPLAFQNTGFSNSGQSNFGFSGNSNSGMNQNNGFGNVGQTNTSPGFGNNMINATGFGANNFSSNQNAAGNSFLVNQNTGSSHNPFQSNNFQPISQQNQASMMTNQGGIANSFRAPMQQSQNGMGSFQVQNQPNLNPMQGMYRPPQQNEFQNGMANPFMKESHSNTFA